MDGHQQALNGFAKHGIDHLSASSINLWTNAPDVWVARYLLKVKMPFGPAPKRGIEVERAVVDTLSGNKTEGQAIKDAEERFADEFLAVTDAVEKELQVIRPMTQIAVEELMEFGAPQFESEDGQDKIRITAQTDDWSIPVIGYLDMVFPQHGTIVDLKTTNRIPTSMSADHQLQRAIYAHAKGNHRVAFLYVSSKKAKWLEDGEPGELLANAKCQIIRLEAFLRHNTAETARETVPVNPNSYFWRDAQDIRREIYGV